MLSDFLEFSRHHLASRDVDPMYDVLKALYHSWYLESKIEHTLMYLMYYNVISAHEAWHNGWRLSVKSSAAMYRLPAGTERRGFRSPEPMQRHAEALRFEYSKHGSWTYWLSQGFVGDRFADWETVSNTLGKVWGNGRWASYKGCELLQKVCGLYLEPPNMGHEGSSGPRKGLALLYPDLVPDHEDQSKAAIDTLDRLSHWLMAVMRGVGLTPQDLGEVETCLCDFHTMVDSRYYVGHDIDEMQEKIGKAQGAVRQELMWARWSSLPHSYLGEVGGWHGVDKDRCRAYKETGKILVRP